MGKLDGKIALITGGTSGIGLATAKLFMAEGAKIIITGMDADRLADAQHELGSEALVIRSDSGNLNDIKSLINRAGALGGLDILFLNAGMSRVAPIEAVSENEFDETINTNLKGIFFTIQHALPLCRGGASIIVTTSITNQLGSPGLSIYGASKAALRSLVKSLGLELIGRGIRVNAISPGPIETPIFNKFGLPAEVVQTIKADMADKSPIKRFGSPEEIAKTVLFLASSDSSYLVGEEIVVDGGMSLL
ncbi:MAG: 3-oxoacyl-[acyl-carrier protein] reductase [Rhodocyclales bacterium]|nr:3-oxoacyl-[acyl-carrier protein] reductase [Rhodocyclales bacterium]